MYKEAAEAELYVLSSHRLFDLASVSRDRISQALLFMEESSVPVDCDDVADLLDGEEFKLLISALGVGVDLSRFWQDRHPETFALDKLRYHKILLLADDSPLGARVREQLITWLFLYFGPVMKGGYVYLFEEAPSDEITQDEFDDRFMLPENRSIRRVAMGDTLSETLAQL